MTFLTSGRGYWTVHIVGFVIAAILLGPWLSTFGTRVVGDDSLEVNVPHLTFEKAAVKEGHFPFWNPYSQAGTPDVGSPFYDFFYPLHWLILLFPIHLGINLSFLVHIGIGWAGSFLFFRTFAGRIGASIGAWTFILSAPILHFPQGGYLGTFYSVVGLTWCLWMLHRALDAYSPWTTRAWAMTAGLPLAFGMNVIASYALIFQFMPAAIYVLCRNADIRKKFETVFLFGLTGALVSAARIWPWYLLTLETNRSGAAADLAFSAAGSVHPLYLFNYLFPGALPHLSVTGLTMKGYMGVPWLLSFAIVPILLFGKSFWEKPHGKFFMVLYLFSFSMIFGIYSPVFLTCFYFLPGFSVTSHPNIYTWLAAFAAAGCAAVFLEQGSSTPRPARRILLVAAGIAILSIGLISLLPVESTLIRHFLEHREGLTPEKIIGRLAASLNTWSMDDATNAIHAMTGRINFARLCWAMVWIVACVSILKAGAGKRAFGFGILIAVDLLFHPLPSWQLTDPHAYYPETKLHARLAEESNRVGAEPFRIYPVGGTYNTEFFKFNQGCVLRVESIKGETGFFLRDEGLYFNRLMGWPLPVKKRYAQFYGTMDQTESRLLDLLNVKYFLSDTPLADPDLTPVDSDAGLTLYENRRALPRAFFSGQIQKAGSLDDLFARIEKDDYDPRMVLYTLSDVPTIAALDTIPTGTIQTVRRGPNALALTLHSEKGGWVCVSEPFVAGWGALMDGQTRLDAVKVNGLFQSYYVPAGDHVIALSYVPKGFGAGLAVSGVGLALWAGALAMARRRSED